MSATAFLRRLVGCGAMAVLALALTTMLTAAPVVPAEERGGLLRPAALWAPRAAPLIIGTVPAVAGFPVILDGVTRLTDSTGYARFSAVDDGRPLSDRITLTDAILVVDGRQVKVRGNSLVESGPRPLIRLDISYQVRFRFSTVDGAPIDGSSIDAISLQSTNGEVVDLQADESPWLRGTRVVQVLDDLEVRHIGWSVQRVAYAGSNVVNASQQTFLPAEKQDVDVTLLFFGVEFRVRDAFFGYSHSGAVDLVYPDGTSRRFPLDGDGRLSLPELPRGDYTLTTIGPGPNMSRPLSISRNQEVDLAFYSWVDIFLALVVLLAAALGLASWGRARRRRGRGRHRYRYRRTWLAATTGIADRARAPGLHPNSSGGSDTGAPDEVQTPHAAEHSEQSVAPAVATPGGAP